MRLLSSFPSRILLVLLVIALATSAGAARSKSKRSSSSKSSTSIAKTGRSGSKADRSTTVPTSLESSKLPSPLKILWLDNESGVVDLSKPGNVIAMLDKAKAAGFNVIVPDVKNFHGLPFYKSQVTTQPASVRGRVFPPDYDFLRVVTQEAHKRGLRVHAGMNMFVEGQKDSSTRLGEAYQHPDWQAVVYDLLPQLSLGEQFTTFVQTLNDRTGAPVSVFTPAYGEKLFRRDSAQNVVDGVKATNASRWVSADTSTTHWLEFSWPEEQKVTSVTITFPAGYAARDFDILTSQSNVAHVRGNTQQERTVTLGEDAADGDSTSPAARTTRRLRISFPPTGKGRMARVEEVEIQDGPGKNIAPLAKVQADSTLARGAATLFVVHDDKVSTLVKENDLNSAGVCIPRHGMVVWVEGKQLPKELVPVKPDTPSTLTAQKVLVPESRYPAGTLIYTNPANPEVRRHNLKMIEEVLGGYEVDGVILDRARYDNLSVDFSDLSRDLFQKEMKVRVENWPEDILTPPNPVTGEPMKKGPLFQKWILWRAKTIHDFFVEVRSLMERFPNKVLGDYVGGWYRTYWEVGVNWANSDYDPSGDFPGVPPGYKATGYAQLLDYLSPGLYYPALYREGAKNPEQTVEGGILLAQRLTLARLPLAPGLYVPNLSSEQDYEQAIRLCIERTSGVMIFSHSSVEQMKRWEATRRGLEAIPQLPE